MSVQDPSKNSNTAGNPVAGDPVDYSDRNNYSNNGTFKMRQRMASDVWDYDEHGLAGIGQKDIDGWRKAGKSDDEIFSHIDAARREGNTNIGIKAYSQLQRHKSDKEGGHDLTAHGGEGFGQKDIDALTRQGMSQKQIAGLIRSYQKEGTAVGAKANQYEQDYRHMQHQTTLFDPTFNLPAQANLADGKVKYAHMPENSDTFKNDTEAGLQKFEDQTGIKFHKEVSGMGPTGTDMVYGQISEDRKSPYGGTSPDWEDGKLPEWVKGFSKPRQGVSSATGTALYKKGSVNTKDLAEKNPNYWNHIFAHETGHNLGLGHTQKFEDVGTGKMKGAFGEHHETDTIMSYGQNDWGTGKLTERDKDQLWHLGYDVKM